MGEIIRRALSSDIERLRTLWDECFPDDTAYADFFFENIFKLNSAVVFEKNGEVCGMIHVFPRIIATPQGEMSAKYIYGVGTDKKYRGLGIAGKLLESEAKDCDMLVLIPANEGLFEFYKKYGFEEICEVGKFIAKPLGTVDVRRAEYRDIPFINEVYQKCCHGGVFAKRDEATWKLLFSEYEFFGGGFLVFPGGYCAHYEHEGKLFISEFFSEDAPASSVAGALGREVEVTTRGCGKKLSVVRPISDKAEKMLSETVDRYINLMHN
ncbi:MAG: GNAT family N-acetyltransferase [Oscillospiraceae bacterium]|nr:GNAT family N-acetyltransferase [Oscillospiraceae bacterium]